MNILRQAKTDTGMNERSAEGAFNLLRKMIKDSQGANELASKIDAAAPNAKAQWAIAHLLMILAEEAGKARAGTPELADSILDQQGRKIKQYGDSAYRLSEKQMQVVSRAAWGYLRPEMPR